MPTATTIAELQIAPGRALFLNPADILTDVNVRRYCLDNVNPLGGNSPHYFICVAADGVNGLWCPVSSNWKPHGSPYQGRITQEYKNGFDNFVNNDCWYDIGQVWKIPHNRAFAAAIAHSRNDINADGNLNAVFPAVADAVFWGGSPGISGIKIATLRSKMNTPPAALTTFGFQQGVIP